MKPITTLLTGGLAAALFLSACQPIDLTGGEPGGPAPIASLEPETQASVDAAIALLAEKLGRPAAEILFVEATSVEFSDSCLGIAIPEAMCAAVITPGYRVTLSAGDLAYVVHTNQDASYALENEARLLWGRTGGFAGVCQALEIERDGVIVAGPCGSLDTVELTEAERAQLLEWLARFGETRFTSDDLADGTVVADGFVDDLYLVGTGTATPNAAEKQAMLDWAAEVYTRLTTQS